MRLPKHQRGLGLWGWIFVLGIIGFAATITLKVVPMYLNQMKIAKAVKTVAGDPGNAQADPVTLRKALERFWDVEDIRQLSHKDIKVVRLPSGSRALAYDYEARDNVFKNIYIVIHFKEEVPMRTGGGGMN
jgi:hypothetical protein